VQELREQMRMYEMASQCSAVLASSRSASTAAAALKSATSNLDDSYNQLGIKKSSGVATLSR